MQAPRSPRSMPLRNALEWRPRSNAGLTYWDEHHSSTDQEQGDGARGSAILHCWLHRERRDLRIPELIRFRPRILSEEPPPPLRPCLQRRDAQARGHQQGGDRGRPAARPNHRRLLRSTASVRCGSAGSLNGRRGQTKRPRPDGWVPSGWGRGDALRNDRNAAMAIPGRTTSQRSGPNRSLRVGRGQECCSHGFTRMGTLHSSRHVALRHSTAIWQSAANPGHHRCPHDAPVSNRRAGPIGPAPLCSRPPRPRGRRSTSPAS